MERRALSICANARDSFGCMNVVRGDEGMQNFRISLVIASLTFFATAPVKAEDRVRAVSQLNGVSVDNYDEVSVSAQQSGPAGSSRAATDLARGEMKVFATATLGNAGALSSYFDDLQFSIPGATADTQTVIQINASFHAIRNAGASASYNASSSYAVNGNGILGFYFSKQSNGEFAYIHINGQTNFTENAGDYLSASTSYTLVGANPTIRLSGQTGAFLSGDATVDAMNTAKVGFTLPQGVTFTSRSGVFLSAVGTVPEPSTWAFMVIGFGLVGAAIRCRRKYPQATVIC